MLSKAHDNGVVRTHGITGVMGAQKDHGTLLPMIRGNGVYFLRTVRGEPDIKDPSRHGTFNPFNDL